MKTPGPGVTFTYYYEFTLPKAEFVSASMSISGPTSDQIPSNSGSFILADWTNTGSSAPYVPSGATIEDVTISGPAPGGEGAFLGTMTSMGDPEPAGTYFVEITGVSGGGGLQLAVDGNVTATAPEPSTWAMVLLGFAGLGFASYRRRRKGRLSDALA
jgi:PEP-CTERM motif